VGLSRAYVHSFIYSFAHPGLTSAYEDTEDSRIESTSWGLPEVLKTPNPGTTQLAHAKRVAVGNHQQQVLENGDEFCSSVSDSEGTRQDDSESLGRISEGRHQMSQKQAHAWYMSRKGGPQQHSETHVIQGFEQGEEGFAEKPKGRLCDFCPSCNPGFYASL
jgi:hypothetical protein